MSNAETITTLATQDEIDDCFNHPAGANSELEIHYRTDRTGTPVKGYRIGTQKLLVKVVKRRRKDGKGGVFTTEVVGPISQTVRFRCESRLYNDYIEWMLMKAMADHHFTPNNDGQAQQLLTTLRDLDCGSST
jgi:general transcription factor 3C polypeptide 5 (transcription factor C subunit 1)